MKIIGITGGVGSGKSQILSYIANKYHCKVLMADVVAQMFLEPGHSCYDQLVSLLGKEIIKNDQTIDRGKMGEKIFFNKNLLYEVNKIIHPAVKTYIKNCIKEEQIKGMIDFFFIEAALLIEDNYAEIIDELWYIYATIEIRQERLQTSRQYSKEKIDSIMKEQLSEEEFRKHCDIIIDNSNSLQESYNQIDKKLGEYLWQR